MHLLFPRPAQDEDDDCEGHRLRRKFIGFLSPPSRANSAARRFFFSMFYTVAHVFTFMNTIIYWAVLVPAGHGGFKVPKFPHHHHGPEDGVDALYDPRASDFSLFVFLFAVGMLSCWLHPVLTVAMEADRSHR